MAIELKYKDDLIFISEKSSLIDLIYSIFMFNPADYELYSNIKIDKLLIYEYEKKLNEKLLHSLEQAEYNYRPSINSDLEYIFNEKIYKINTRSNDGWNSLYLIKILNFIKKCIDDNEFNFEIKKIPEITG